jgi:hypothetical protein
MTSPIFNQIDSVSCGIHVVAFTLTRLTGQSTSDYDSVYMWHRFGLKWTMRSVHADSINSKTPWIDYIKANAKMN